VHWIVVRDGRVTNRRLAGGAGTGLDYALGAGPAGAPSHWDDRGELAGWWTDDVCDGGAVIDADRRVLLFFAAWAVPAYGAAMLDGFARVWSGWQIAWAAGGVTDLARYLGLDPAAVRTGTPSRLTQPEPGSPHLAAALEELAKRVETFVPGDIGLRAMRDRLEAGAGPLAALEAMERARDAATPAASAAAKLIRGH
jgi:GNAT superfamily N-acetyltransferase